MDSRHGSHHVAQNSMSKRLAGEVRLVTHEAELQRGQLLADVVLHRLAVEMPDPGRDRRAKRMAARTLVFMPAER